MNTRINLSAIPENPGVYMMIDNLNNIIYIGKAVNLKNRIKSYFQNNKDDKTKSLVENIHNIDYIITDNEIEALILESTLIKKFKPKYNILLKDNKELPYIKITIKDKYPKILEAKKITNDGSKYYGPYHNLSTMHEIKNLIEKLFPVKNCDIPVYKDRPCLYYHLNQCLAPCINYVSSEEYKSMIDKVCELLEGKTKSIIKELNSKMNVYSENLQFEKAAEIRDNINLLNKYFDKQKIISNPDDFYDVIGYHIDFNHIVLQVFQIREGKIINKINFDYQYDNENINDLLSNFIFNYYNKTQNFPNEIIINDLPSDIDILQSWLYSISNKKIKFTLPKKSDKRKILDMVNKNCHLYLENLKKNNEFLVSKKGPHELKEYLNLTCLPTIIEAFDISHIQGTNTVASMIVFENGKVKKSGYRKFKLSIEGNPNDFASMYEVIKRRYSKVSKENIPDLILIDGGKGQLNSALQALKDINFTYKNIIAIAKKQEEIFLPNQKESIILPKNSFALKLIQNVRDEAHRFAITFHKNLRNNKMLKSLLDDIKGIGPKRKKFLIENFENISNLSNLSLEELVKIGKLPLNVAKELYNKLR
ncbi:MAG: UvrABC system protein C [Candidatus Sericytochromatia bacterium]|nr:MAG: UvrABC system protein C [Candidatus Sericytochromatia bacterium]